LFEGFLDPLSVDILAAMIGVRKLLNLIVTLRLVVAALALVGISGAKPGTGSDNACGPPNYCARTDRSIEPYQAKPPALGPAGSIVRDPAFSSRILRVTDTKSDPNGIGRSLMTPSSSEQNAWNADGTKFYVVTPGGQYVLYDFDPDSLKVHSRGIIKARSGGEPEFSFTRPNILYLASVSNPAFLEYNVSTGQINRLNKFSDCVKLNSSDFAFGVSISANDLRMTTPVGPEQDRNFMVYVYDRKQGCRWYNTRTGEIGGEWGPKGTIPVSDRYSIHNLRISKSGDFVWIQRGESTVGSHWLVWDVSTMNVVACSSQCSGHHAMGYSHLIGASGKKHPLDLILRPLNRPADVTSLIPDLQPTSSARYWYDQHYSWNHISAADTTPVCLSTYSDNNPNAPDAPLDTIAPWENEILCVEADGKDSRVWRFAHTYSTAKGFWHTPRGNVSQDGRFFMFTSDWQDELGEAPRNKAVHRTDVFIVELR
jgi:hypothetical protein